MCVNVWQGFWIIHWIICESNFPNIFLISCSWADFWYFMCFPFSYVTTVHFSIVSSLNEVFHCMWSLSQANISPLYSCPLASWFLKKIYLIVCEIVEKPCSSNDSNSGLLFELNHLLQIVPLVKWIKGIVVAIWRV